MSQLHRALRQAGSCAAALALIGSAAAWLAPSVAADPGTRLVAIGGTDTGTCIATACATINYAVGQASSGDTISIGAGSYAESVAISKTLTLTGAGVDQTVITGDGKGDGLDIEAPDGATITVHASDLAVSHVANGSGVYAYDAALYMTRVLVSDNARGGIGGYDDQADVVSITQSTDADNAGPGVSFSDGSSPALTVGDSTISGNEPGVEVDGGMATIQNSTLAHNTDQALHITGGTATVLRSTISGTLDDGSWGSLAGAVVAEDGSTFVDTSTIADNAGRGVLAIDPATVTVTDSTVAGTTTGANDKDLAFGGLVASRGGAMPLARVRPMVEAAPADPLTVAGSIVADNTTPGCSGSINSRDFNLSSDRTCGFTQPDDQQGVNPKLGPLQDNGGPTLTMMPGVGSPAIDAIPDRQGTCSDEHPTDQRGTGRPIGSGCDIGAVEAPAAVPPPVTPPTCPPLVITTNTLPGGTVGTPYSVQLQASGGCDNLYSWVVPSEAPDGGFPAVGSQTTAPAGEQTAAARPADEGVTQPVFTPTLHRSPVAAPTSQSAATDTPVTGPAGNTAPPGLALNANGVLSGTPTQAGTFTFTVSVNDPVLTTLVLRVAAAATTGTPTPSSSGTTPAPAGTSHGVGGVSTSAGAPVTTAPPAGSGALANTGTPVGPQLRLAFGLLAAGGAFVLAGARRRRHPRQH